ncbi:MAG: sigma-70 family RNA polymerase sigma factor, partial [Anaerolineae bacterium]
MMSIMVGAKALAIDKTVQRQLIKKGEKQGYLTYDDILAVIPDAEQNLDQVEEVMDQLNQAGVMVLTEPPPAVTEPETDLSESGDVELEPDLDSEMSEQPSDDELAELESDPFGLDLIQDSGYQQAIETDDVVGLYLKEAGRTPLLTGEEEVSLAKRMEAGWKAKDELDAADDDMPMDDRIDLQMIIDDGDEAQEHLVKANSRLVISVAKKYIGRGVHFLDLIQEGNIGLIRAARKFEYQRGHKFSTYATWWIRQAVSRAVADQGRTIRVPVHMGDQINRLRRITMRLTQELGRDPTILEMADAMQTTPDKVNTLIEVARRPISLETPTDEDEESEIGD